MEHPNKPDPLDFILLEVEKIRAEQEEFGAGEDPEYFADMLN